MEKIKIKKKADCIIVTYKIEKTHQISNKYLDILNGNVIDCLLPLELRSGIAGRSIRVQVKNSIDLLTYLQSGLSFQEFLSVIKKVIAAVQSCEVHGLRTSHLDLLPERTFYSDHGAVLLIYRPMIVLERYSSIAEFLHQLGCLYEAGTSHEYKQKYLELLVDKNNFDLYWFEGSLTSLENDWLQQRSGSSNNAWSFHDHSSNGYSSNDHTCSFTDDNDHTQALYDDNDSTQSLYDDSTMSLLSVSFVVLRTNQRVTISNFPYSIGKRVGFCDYAISDNNFISKKHIVLERKNNRIFVKDNNTTNGTKLDGVLIAPKQEYELRSNCILELGNEKIQFLF